jgi:Uma2 family endonuclease
MHAIALERRHRFPVEDWLRLGESGVFPPDYRGELIEGEIVDMVPIGPNPSGCLKWLGRFFNQRLGETHLVSIQDPIRLGELSAPQPDLALLRPRPDYYRSALPGPQDVLLLVEVADTTLRYDREVKAPLYARFGIPEYWLVNLPDQCVEVYRKPAPGGYLETTRYAREDSLAPLFRPEAALTIRELLG